MPRRLRVGVPAGLLELEPRSGHGKVWHRVLSELASTVRITRLGSRSPFGRRPRGLDVVLASGHDELPATGGVPLVVQVHEAAWFRPELRAVLDPRFIEHIAPLTELAVSRAERVVTPSEASRRDLIATYGLHPGSVVAAHHGVDPIFRPDAADPKAERIAALGPYVLYAAMIHPRKNLAAVRTAIELLVAGGHDLRLVIVGGPATDRDDSAELERAAAAELAGAAGRVTRVTEPTNETLAALMAGARAFCLPSLYEGFGLTVLEAMACGTVPVVSDRGALPEVVGDSGLVTAPGAEEVAKALRALLADPERRSRLEREAAARARSFTWTRAAEGWLRALTEATESSV